MKSPHIVRKWLADGTIKEYRYIRHRQRRARDAAGSIGALIETYKQSPEWAAKAPNTKTGYERYLRWLECARAEPVMGLRRRHMLLLRDALAATDGPAAATKFVRVVSALLTWAVDREWIEVNPLARVRALPGGHWRAWTAAEYDSIVPRLPEPLRRAVMLARYTGQRRGDLCAMRWSQYDGATLRVTQQKTRTPLVIPVAAALRAELDAWRSGPVAPHPERRILLTSRGRPWDPGYLSRATGDAVTAIDRKFRSLNIHGLRKLAAASLAECGCSASEIAAVTGHRTLALVQLYTASAEQERLATAAVTRLETASVNRGKPPHK
jgi:integrase